MDRDHIARLIERIRAHAAVHDQQFAGRPEHANCLKRYDDAIDKLEKELQKLEERAAKS